MKIVQVTDLHLARPGETVAGLDPYAGLDACLVDILRHHADAAVCVLTGDLTNDGQPEAYAALAERLRAFPIPVRLLLGNHDDRPAFRGAFPEAEVDENGFVQSVLDGPAGRLIFLDTLDPGHVGGRLCATRLAWLDGRLEEAAERPVYVFLHHPPFAVHIPAIDACRLAEADADALAQRLKAHGGVRHVFAGHVHRPIFGSWHGIPVSVLRGTNHQMGLEMTGARAGVSYEAPAYGIAVIDAAGLMLHMREFPLPPPRP